MKTRCRRNTQTIAELTKIIITIAGLGLVVDHLPSIMKVKVLYFARVRELAERDAEELEVEGTVADLLEVLKGRLPSLAPMIQDIQAGTSDVALALNMEYTTNLAASLTPNCEFAFIPPIGGG